MVEFVFQVMAPPPSPVSGLHKSPISCMRFMHQLGDLYSPPLKGLQMSTHTLGWLSRDWQNKEVKMTLENERWATVAEAAQHFKTTRQWIHKLIQKGYLGKTKKVDTPRGSVWFIEYPFRRFPTVSGGQTKKFLKRRRNKQHGDL